MGPLLPLGLFAALALRAEEPPKPTRLLDERAYRERVLPLLTSGPRLPDGEPRFSLGEGEQAGKLLDRSVDPPRALSEEEVELLTSLREPAKKPKNADERAQLVRTAAVARRSPALFGGRKKAEEVAGYLDAVAAGATDRVEPMELKRFAPRAAPEAAPPARRAPAPKPGVRMSEPTAPLSPDRVAPPPTPTGAPERAPHWWEPGYWSRPPPRELPAVIVPVAPRGVERRGPPGPEARLARLKETFKKKDPKLLAIALTELSGAAASGVPGAREALLEGFEVVEREGRGEKAEGWGDALRVSVGALSRSGRLDAATAARAAAALKSLAASDPKLDARSVGHTWERLSLAAKGDPAAERALEEARAPAVAAALSREKERLLALEESQGALGHFKRPPFEADARAAAVAEAVLAEAPKAPGLTPSARAWLVVEAAAELNRRSALGKEEGVAAVEAVAGLFKANPRDGFVRLAAERVREAVRDKSFVLYVAAPAGAKPPSKEEVEKAAAEARAERRREERLAAAREMMADVLLPEVLEGYRRDSMRDRALRTLGSPVLQGVPKVMAAMLEELKTAAKDPASGPPALLFARTVQAAAGNGESLDGGSARAVVAAARALGVLTPPGAAGKAADYDVYLKAVETARNALRGSDIPSAERAKALEDFDADFAKAYDAGRASPEPREALAALMKAGPSWLKTDFVGDALAFRRPDSRILYDQAVRETAARFFDRAGLSDPRARALSEATRAARLAGGEPPLEEDAPADTKALREALGGKVSAAAEEFLSKMDGSVAPPSSAHLYAEAYRLENMRAALASLPADDPRRKELAAAVDARARSLAEGASRLAALSRAERTDGDGGSRDQTHARMTALLALPPDRVPEALRKAVAKQLDEWGPLAAGYDADTYAFGEGRGDARSGAGRNVLVNLFAVRTADAPAEKEKRLVGLEESLAAFARYEPVLRATMHRYIKEQHPHFYEPVGLSGSDALAPYYYPSAIPRVIEAYALVLNDPAVRADPARLKRAQEGYKTVRDGLLKEVDLKSGLREPLRRDLPWYYTLLGTGVAEVVALEHPPK